jgi:hypothetical protein
MQPSATAATPRNPMAIASAGTALLGVTQCGPAKTFRDHTRSEPIT